MQEVYFGHFEVKQGIVAGVVKERQTEAVLTPAEGGCKICRN